MPARGTVAVSREAAQRVGAGGDSAAAYGLVEMGQSADAADSGLTASRLVKSESCQGDHPAERSRTREHGNAVETT